MLSIAIINRTISFFIHILNDLDRKDFSFLKPLIESIQYYYKQFQIKEDFEYLQNMVNQLISYQTHKDVMSYLFAFGIDILKDIITYSKDKYSNFLQYLTIRLLEMYSYFTNFFVKDYIKLEKLNTIIDHLRSNGNKEDIIELFYDDCIINIIIPILYTSENSFLNFNDTTSKSDSKNMFYTLMNNISSTSEDKLQSPNLETQFEKNVLFAQAHEHHEVQEEKIEYKSNNSPVIEKNNEEDKDNRLKRIIGKYGTHRHNEVDKSPPKNEIIILN